MFFKPQIVFSWLVLLLSFTSLFLSSWILLPAPNMSLLTLAVGAPEVSPWLFLLNLFSLLLSFFCIRRYKIRRLASIFSSIGLLICAWVLANIPLTQMQMDKAMKQGLGTDYLEQIPVQVRVKCKPIPLI